MPTVRAFRCGSQPRDLRGGKGRAIYLAVALALTPSAFGQTGTSYNPPLAQDGHPDLQGNWTNRWATPLERPPEVTALELEPAEAAGLLKRFSGPPGGRNSEEAEIRGPNGQADITGLVMIGGKARTSLIVDPPDGRLPYAAEGRARRARLTPDLNLGEEGPERRNLTERCLMGGAGYAPFLPMPSGNIRQIVQTPDHLAIITESFSMLRVIPISRGDGDRPAGAMAPRGGASTAHWEDETLVIVTNGLSEEDGVRFSTAGVLATSPGTRITERLKRTGPEEILYRFTVEDPTLYARAWTGESTLKLTDERMYEGTCHEANYSLPNILRGARIAEARASARKRK